MSIKLASSTGLAGRIVRSRTLTSWVRNPSWSALPDVTGLAKFVGLHAVYAESNFLAVVAAGSLGYTVDWGDGTPTENIGTGAQAYHQYDFAAAGLASTNAPVTLTDVGDLVTRTAHGYTDGMTVSFFNIVSTTGLTAGFVYYVISATANTFQVSLTSGGSAVALTTDGSATLLNYKQAIVSIVPQGAGTFTLLNLNSKYPAVGGVTLPAYTSGFLDIAVAGTALTTLTVGDASPVISFNALEQAQLIGSNSITNFTSVFHSCSALRNVPAFNAAAGTNFTNMFNSCYALQNVVLTTTAAGTTFTGMFRSCIALQSVPLFNTAAGIDFSLMFSNCSTLQFVPLFNTAAGTNFTSMFAGCYNLQTVPLFNTAAGTNFTSMFTGCYALQTVPLFNTAAGTNFTSMFTSCYALRSVPLFNTAAGTNFTSMFTSCYNLQSVPLFNTAAGTNFLQMLNGCASLRSVPLFNTAAGTSFSNMFGNCYALQSVPLFNTAAGTDFSLMFNNCYTLQSVPLFNTAAGTTFSTMFNNCITLQSVPLFNTAAGTNFTSMFNSCTSLQSVPLFNTAAGTSFSNMFAGDINLAVGKLSGTTRDISYSILKLSKTALEDIFNGLGKAFGAQTINVDINWGAPAVVSLTGTTTAGSTLVTMASTTGITVGMQVTGTNSPLTTAIAVTLQDVGDTVTLAAHGLSNGDEVSFATIVTTTGIATNIIYFVVSATANTFQVALTAGGAAIALTTNGSGTLRYRTTVSSIVVNTSVTLSRPATGTGTVTLGYRLLTTGTALLKGWTVYG